MDNRGTRIVAYESLRGVEANELQLRIENEFEEMVNPETGETKTEMFKRLVSEAEIFGMDIPDMNHCDFSGFCPRFERLKKES